MCVKCFVLNKLYSTFVFLPSLIRKKTSGLESTATIRTKVFVWGLNDKDQLGGLKGSKVLTPFPVADVSACCCFCLRLFKVPLSDVGFEFHFQR